MSAVTQENAKTTATSLLTERPMFVDPREKRLGGALSASLVLHIAMLFIFLGLSQIPRGESTVYKAVPTYDLVWLAEVGPGGGGGGGGNETPAPPQKLQTPGKDQLSVPVARKPAVEPLEQPKDVPAPEPQIMIPAQTMASALATLPGTIEGLPEPTGSQGPGTGGGSGTGTGTGSGPGRGSGLGEGEGGGTGGGYYRPGSGIELPRVIREVKPQYTADAMRAKIQGIVELEAIVLPDGTVGQVNITRSLDRTFGLDAKAIEAVRQWRFVPGTRFGSPVSVLVTVELTFTLR
jgi:periplasmic protein TonB